MWTLVYSDDPPDLVQSVLDGTVNWTPCHHPNCGFEGGWLWPSAFLYIDLQEQRAVCVTLATAAELQFGLLREALDVESIYQRGLDPQILLKKTSFAKDYRKIQEALEVDLGQLELENTSILKYIERKGLRGRERIEALIEAVLEAGIISFEGGEISSEFVAELVEYQSSLTGEEDPRIPSVLKQSIDVLRQKIEDMKRMLPSRDGESALADVLRAARNVADHTMAKASFERQVTQAEQHALQLRLARLCELQADNILDASTAAPIDARPELLELVEQTMAGHGLEDGLLAEIEVSVLPDVKQFLESIPPLSGPFVLPPYKPKFEEPPVPSWIVLATEVFEKIMGASSRGLISPDLLDPVADEPLARVCVEGDIARALIGQNELSGAMLHMTKAMETLESTIGDSDSTDYWTARIHAICLERMGDIQLRFGRLEESIKAQHAAQAIYERIQAKDGLLYSLSAEASIWLDLGQRQRAEALFARLVQETAGRGRSDEARALANLANVYRRLPPYADAEMTFGSKESEATKSEDEGAQGRESAVSEGLGEAFGNSFEAKAGLRISTALEDHEELNYRDMVGSEPLRLLFLGLAVAKLNQDESFEKLFLGRLAAVYGEFGCDALGNLALDKLLEMTRLEEAGADVHLLVLNRLSAHALELDRAGKAERALASRQEQLEIFDFILQTPKGPGLAEEELRSEKATLLESLGRWEEAREEYLETIERLERSRGWMRDPENKRGLQAGRWRPYVRGARTALRLYEVDPNREDLLVEAWQLTQAGRSRALLDAVGAQRDPMHRNQGVASIRPDSFSAVANRLPKDVAILEYFLMPTTPGGPGAWAMMVVEPGVSTPWLAWQEPDMDPVWAAKEKVTDLGKEYEKQVVQYGIASSLESLEQRYIAALENLADAILPAGLVDQLHERGYRRLVVVADAYLHEVPFVALRPMQGGRRTYLGLPDEGGGFEVMYAPSSSIFAYWSGLETAVASRKRTALFVDPLGDLSQGSPEVLPTFQALENQLHQQGVSVTRYDGARATPEVWLHEAPSHDLMVYFGHSVAGQGDPEQSVLVMNDGSGSPAPMSAGDVYRRSSDGPFSNSSMVVLASCSGGLAFAGSWDSDRELTGLSVAHLHAGCRAVIAASRPLLDQPTLVLLESFLGRVLGGDDALTSLTRAQRELAESDSPYSHPHFWGYLGLMGVPDWRLDREDGGDG